MPYRAVSLEPGSMMHRVELDEGREIVARAVLLATGADYRRLAIPDLEQYEGLSIFYAAGPPEARACSGTGVGVVGGGNSAGQAAVWLARGGALVTLLHRRADLRETMSNYLVAGSSWIATASPCATAARSPSCTARTASSTA
jgi:thioredoxin reductase (NADPH)